MHFACSEDLGLSSNDNLFSEDKAIALISELNTHAVLEIDKAFTVKTAIEITLEEEDNHKIWSLVFKKPGTKEKYLVDLGLLDAFDMPTNIDNASITYLQDQIIIEDLNSDFELNFFIEKEESVDKVPEIGATNGLFLRISTFTGNNKAKGKCSCKCSSCIGSIQGCPSSTQCSCTSSCNGCSITCAGKNNAVCNDTCTVE